MWYWWVLDYSSCKCRKRLVDKLVEECSKNIEETKLVENENKDKCSSCTLYIVLFSIIFAINNGIGIYFVCFRWYLKKDIPHAKFNTNTQTTI